MLFSHSRSGTFGASREESTTKVVISHGSSDNLKRRLAFGFDGTPARAQEEGPEQAKNDADEMRLAIPSHAAMRMGLSPVVSYLIVQECWASRGLLNYVFAVLGVGLNVGSAAWACTLVRYVSRTYWPSPQQRTQKPRDP